MAENIKSVNKLSEIGKPKVYVNPKIVKSSMSLQKIPKGLIY